MKRDPAIHIVKSKLVRILQGYGLTVQDIDGIMISAHKYSIRNRVIVSFKAKNKKKVESFIETSTPHVEEFNRIYKGVLVTKDIKAMTIRKSSRQYLSLIEITKQALEFCSLFELGMEEGFKKYVEIGVLILGRKFNIYRLLSASSQIVEYHKNYLLLSNDPDPDKTDLVISAWRKAMKTFFNFDTDISGELIHRIHFYYAKQDAEKAKAAYQDWINAQFDKWSYLNSPPQLSQLYGENAGLVYKLYMAKIHQGLPTDYSVTKLSPIDEETERKKKVREARLQKGLSGAGQPDNG